MKTPKGDVSTHAAQTKPDISVTDKHSALHSLAMRNHGTTNEQRDSMVNTAQQHSPNEADNAQSYDADCADDMSATGY